MKAVIVDDDKTSVELLGTVLKNYYKDVEVVSKCTDPDHGLEAIHQLRNDDQNVVFMDIHMPKASGFEILSKVENYNFQTIFTTNHHDYALQALKFEALDYLIKPISPQDLQSPLKKAKSKLPKQYEAKNFNFLWEMLSGTINFQQNVRIALPTLEGIEFHDLDHIIRCEAQLNYTLFIFDNSKKMLTSKNMGEYEELLKTSQFMRIHRSHMVNLAHVKKYLKGDGGQLVMSDGSIVDVSRVKKQEILDRLMLRNQFYFKF